MTTLPEALAALDALGCCNESCCALSADNAGKRGKDGCRTLQLAESAEDMRRLRAIAAVVRAARAEVGRRARVQADEGRRGRGVGTISWAEHLEVWSKYAQRHGKGQSAEHIEERGGWGYDEAEKLLGRPLATWEPWQ